MKMMMLENTMGREMIGATQMMMTSGTVGNRSTGIPDMKGNTMMMTSGTVGSPNAGMPAIREVQMMMTNGRVGSPSAGRPAIMKIPMMTTRGSGRTTTKKTAGIVVIATKTARMTINTRNAEAVALETTRNTADATVLQVMNGAKITKDRATLSQNPTMVANGTPTKVVLTA